MCAQKLAHTLLSLSYCKLFVAWFALYSPLGQTFDSWHLPSLSLDSETIQGFYAQPTKHLFLDCTKEDGGISSCPRNVLKAPCFVFVFVLFFLLNTIWCKKRILICSSFYRILFWMLFCTLNSCFSFLVYILVIFLILFFLYIYRGIYENKLWTQESHFFLLKRLAENLKASFDNYL